MRRGPSPLSCCVVTQPYPKKGTHPMSTPKQIAANRRHAGKSSGPRTTRGKARTRLNASKQGLPANQVVLLGEDLEQYQSRLNAWTGHLAPTGPVELYL